MATTTPTYEELRQRLIDGDTTVTQSQLDTAWAKHESQQRYAAIQSEAETAAEQRTAEEQRQAAIQTLRTRAEAANNASLTALQAAYRAALEGMRALRDGMQAYNTEAASIDRLAQELGAEDVTAPQTFSVDHELDRLDQQSRTDHPHHKDTLGTPYSRLLDTEYVTEADAEWDRHTAVAAQQDAERRAELAG